MNEPQDNQQKLSTENIDLVHKILLTDPDEEIINKNRFHCTFSDFVFEFRNNNGQNNGELVDLKSKRGGMVLDYVMKKAYFDYVIEMGQKQENFAPYNSLCQSLIDKLKTLIHSLNNHSDTNTNLIKKLNEIELDIEFELELFNPLIAAAQVLQQLETPDSAENTLLLMNECKQHDYKSVANISSLMEFSVYICVYLMLKCEQCASDVAVFHMQKIRPIVYSQGHSLEYQHFKNQYISKNHTTKVNDNDSLTDSGSSSLPLTRDWIKRTMMNDSSFHFNDYNSSHETVSSSSPNINHQHQQLNQTQILQSTGFVDELLFSSESHALPEVFALDLENICIIREATKAAVIGSAIGLHICSITGTPSSILETFPVNSEFRVVRDDLIITLTRKYRNQTELETNLKSVVRSISQSLLLKNKNQNLDESQKIALDQITLKTCTGDDAVRSLLDKRMREFFRFMIICSISNHTNDTTTASDVPVCLQSGLVDQTLVDTKNKSKLLTRKKRFYDFAQMEAAKRGFSFFAQELAEVTYLTRKVVENMEIVYGQSVLEPLIRKSKK